MNNGFGNEVTRLLGIIQTNDTDTKQAIQTDRDATTQRMSVIEQGITQGNAVMDARIIAIDGRSATADNRITIVESEHMDMMTTRIGPIENEIVTANAAIAGIKSQVAQKIFEIEGKINSGMGTGSGEKKDFNKDSGIQSDRRSDEIEQ